MADLDPIKLQEERANELFRRITGSQGSSKHGLLRPPQGELGRTRQKWIRKNLLFPRKPFSLHQVDLVWWPRRFDIFEDAFSAYKKAKEAYIKEVATKWKDKIDPRAYEALMNYQVEITD